MAVQLVFYFFEKKVAAEVMDFRGVSKITFPFISVFLIFKSANDWGGPCPSYATNYGTQNFRTFLSRAETLISGVGSFVYSEELTHFRKFSLYTVI